MKTKSIGFIGGGRITSIFLHALQQTGTEMPLISVYDVQTEVLTSLKKHFPKIQIAESLEKVLDVNLLFLAVHPPVLADILSKISGKVKDDSLIISLAPKITLEKMAAMLDGFPNLARMNPSASSIVAKGVNPVCFSNQTSTTLKNELLEFVQPFGTSSVVEEAKIEAYAVISAMGHTYFFFQLQKLKELAVRFGMEDDEAKQVLSDMLWGTTETLFNSGLTYEEVDNLVPVKPLAEVEEQINNYFEQYLTGIFQKIKP